MSNVIAGRPRPITEVAASVGLGEEELIPYGRYMAKVSVQALAARRTPHREAQVAVHHDDTGRRGRRRVTIGPGALWRTAAAVGAPRAVDRAGSA